MAGDGYSHCGWAGRCKRAWPAGAVPDTQSAAGRNDPCADQRDAGATAPSERMEQLSDNGSQVPSHIEPAPPTREPADDWIARGCAGARAGLEQHLTGRRVIGTMRVGRPPVAGMIFDDGHDLLIARPA